MNEFTFHSDVVHGKEPNDLPNLPLRLYNTETNSNIAACTGPDDGIMIIKRSKLHLSAGPDSDIEFIDTNQEHDGDSSGCGIVKNKSINSKKNSDQNANKPYLKQRKIHITQQSSTKERLNSILDASSCQLNNSIASSQNGQEKSKTLEDKIILTTSKENDINCEKNNSQRNNNENALDKNRESSASCVNNSNSLATSINWKSENEDAYGLSISLYEKNYITNELIGNPIADCYGLIARGDCSIMALADGVNWGKKKVLLY